MTELNFADSWERCLCYELSLDTFDLFTHIIQGYYWHWGHCLSASEVSLKGMGKISFYMITKHNEMRNMCFSYWMYCSAVCARLGCDLHTHTYNAGTYISVHIHTHTNTRMTLTNPPPHMAVFYSSISLPCAAASPSMCRTRLAARIIRCVTKFSYA